MTRRTRPIVSGIAAVVAPDAGCESWSQLLLELVVSHPAVTCAIPATAHVAHVRATMLAGIGRMPEARVHARIAEASRYCPRPRRGASRVCYWRSNAPAGV